MIKTEIKILVDKPFNSQNLSDIKVIHSSIKEVYKNKFTIMGLSKYVFDINTLESIGIEKLKVKIL